MNSIYVVWAYHQNDPARTRMARYFYEKRQSADAHAQKLNEIHRQDQYDQLRYEVTVEPIST